MPCPKTPFFPAKNGKKKKKKKKKTIIADTAPPYLLLSLNTTTVALSLLRLSPQSPQLPPMKAADRSNNEQPAPPAIATTNAISDLRKKNCFTTIARGAPNSDKKKTPKNNRFATVAPNSDLKKKNRSATVAPKNNHSATVLYLCLRGKIKF
nr:hypothetical protein Iba_chr14dCG4180 [Ipomoea batatas]